MLGLGPLEPLLAAFGATAAERDGRVAVSGDEAVLRPVAQPFTPDGGLKRPSR